MLQIQELLCEGKSKRLYRTDDPEKCIIFFKDEAMAFHGLKRGRILGKGEVNNAVFRTIYSLLRENGVESHFVESLDPRQSIVRRCDMIPVAVKVRNRAAGSLVTRVGIPSGTKLEPAVIELFLKNEALENPFVNRSHVEALGLATEEELAFLYTTARRVNEILTDYLREINIELVDFKLEFGRASTGELLLADDISPDNARFWDARTHESLDIDRFRRDLGGAEQAYQELLHRMMGMEA